ncbi:GNAT family N-acetyltransferase [uncultured Jatrophihabitans sp.]|uniref:GNAT family N-acetyltransferase n=1 Tax=uncultured Jatrophihabitans sp. TaxID=1610747 RepID=UPI0035CC83F2
MADVSVRPATAGDASEIARIQIDTWRTAYGDILPEAVLAGLSLAAAEASWTEAITAPPTSRHRVLVAMEQQWRVGFVAFGPADEFEPDDEDTDTTVAVGPVLVEPRWGRRGHGSRLLAATVDLARQDGMTRAVAWIPEGDTPTREFLLSTGWAPDGVVRALDTGAGELREIRLHTSLVEPAA